MSLTDRQNEYIKCAADPIYYLNNYGYVFDARKQRVNKMTCFEYQKECVQNFHKHRNNIVLKSRQCLPGNTLINTPTGKKEIQDFKIGDELYSFNLEKKEVEIDYIKDSWCSGGRQCLNINFGDGTKIECGKEHPFFVKNKNFVKAKKITSGDEIMTIEKKYKIVESVEKTAIKKCFDISVEANENFFADGLLTHNTGLSVITAGYVAWRLIFRKDEKILIIANDGRGAVRFLSAVRQFIDYTPLWLLPKDGARITNNQKEIKLKNNSFAIAQASSPEAGRGDSLTLLVLDETAFIENANTIWMAAGLALSATQGKCVMVSCVPEDTYVFSDKGLKQIKDFKIEDRNGAYCINNYNILGKDNLRSGSLFFNNGFHKTKKLSTTNSFIEGTYNHKVWAYKDGSFNWFKLGDLREGDFISIQHGGEIWGNNDKIENFDRQDSGKCLNKFNPSKITKELAYFLGLFLAEGSVYKVFKKERFVGGTVTISCGDDVSDAIKNIGMKYYLYKDNVHYSISCKQLLLFLEYIGFDLSKKAKEKVIPSRLLEMSRENIIYLLRGIFDGDGYSRKDRGTIGISLSSKIMVDQIRMLLLNFSILTDYDEGITKPTKKVVKSSLYYRIACSGKNSEIFYNKIGFGFERKQNNQKILNQKYNLLLKDRNDVIPGSNVLIKEIVKESKKNTAWFKKNGVKINSQINSKNENYGNISREFFINVFNLIKDDLSEETKNRINKIVCQNLKWNKINKIEYSEKHTYDFSLPETDDFWCHSVLYNGVLGHQTPKGTSNLYHSTWSAADAKEGVFEKDDFIPTKVHWTQNPYCSENIELRQDENGEKTYWSPWYEEQCKRLEYDRVKIAQELDLSFEGSKYLAIENDLISKYNKRLLLDEYKLIDKNKSYYDYKNKPGERFVNYETKFKIYKKYIPGHKYIAGNDVARGDGTDYSTIEIIDIDTLEVVAEYRDKIAPDLFAHVIYNVGMDYGEAYLVVECNSFGLATAMDLSRKMNYRRMYYSKSVKDIYVRPYDYKVEENEEIPGFQTTKRTRPLAINNLRVHLREGALKIYSRQLMDEFMSFIQKGDRPEAEKGKNDDLIFALAIALLIRDTEYQNVAASKEMYKGMLDAIGYKSTTINGNDFNSNPSDNISDVPTDAGGIFFNDFSKEKNEERMMENNDIDWLLIPLPKRN